MFSAKGVEGGADAGNNWKFLPIRVLEMNAEPSGGDIVNLRKVD